MSTYMTYIQIYTAIKQNSLAQVPWEQNDLYLKSNLNFFFHIFLTYVHTKVIEIILIYSVDHAQVL